MKIYFNLFKLLPVILIFASLLVANAMAQKAGSKSEAFNEEYFGKLDSELVPDTGELFGSIFKPFNNLTKYKFVHKIKPGAALKSGSLYNPLISGGKLEVLLIESKEKDVNPYICSDISADGAISDNECLQLMKSGSSANDFSGILKLPINTPLFKNYPVFILFKKDYKTKNLGEDDRLIIQSTYAFATGKVNIKNRPTLVSYKFYPSTSISTTEGLFGLDVDGDGRIRNEPFSVESSYAYKTEPVFRIGDTFVSTGKIDLAKNEIVMRPRLAGEYKRQELQIGTEMPDFSFIDFEGKNRSLSEFRGKYLLIDFWGLWCVDCKREIPFQIVAYQRFRSHGLEILGMDDDEDPEPVKAFLLKNNITWAQARMDSIKNLLEVVYEIQEYPSAVLLDPSGRVIVLDQKKLKGEQLLQTLDQVLPK